MRFFVDAQLPLGLAAWLVEQGHQAHHVNEVDGLDAPDSRVWLTAIELGAIVVSKDRDFVEWALTRTPAVQVLWIRIGNTTNRSLLSHLAGVWRDVIEALERGERVVEVGRR